jgi:hypothetical protein
LEKLENLLSRFELELNHEKTKLIKGPSELEGYWTQLLKDFTERKKIKKNEDLIDLFNLASRLAMDNESDFVFKYFIRRMRMSVFDKNRWETWQNILFSSAFAEFGNLREIYEQLDLYDRIGYKINIKALRNLLEIKVENELKGTISSELSWTLFGFLKFSLKPSRDMLLKVIDNGDDISRIIAIKLAIDKGIGIKKELRQLLNLLDGQIGLSEHWLLFWELYINHWTQDARLKNELLGINIFQLLDSKNISFLRNPQTDLLEVPKPFREKIKEISGSPELERLNREIQNTFHDLPSEIDKDSGSAGESDHDVEEDFEYS